MVISRSVNIVIGLVHQAAINGCLNRGRSKHHTPMEEL